MNMLEQVLQPGGTWKHPDIDVLPPPKQFEDKSKDFESCFTMILGVYVIIFDKIAFFY